MTHKRKTRGPQEQALARGGLGATGCRLTINEANSSTDVDLMGRHTQSLFGKLNLGPHVGRGDTALHHVHVAGGVCGVVDHPPSVPLCRITVLHWQRGCCGRVVQRSPRVPAATSSCDDVQLCAVLGHLREGQGSRSWDWGQGGGGG